MDNLEEGVIILDEKTHDLLFVNKAAETISLKVDSDISESASKKDYLQILSQEVSCFAYIDSKIIK